MSARSRLSDIADSIDALTARYVSAGYILIWPSAYGVALGAAAFAATHPAHWSELEENRVTVTGSREMLLWTLAGLVVVAAIYASAGIRSFRAQRATAAVGDACRRLNARLRFVLALPIVAALAWPSMEANHPLVLVFAALVGLLAAVTVYQWPRATGPSAEVARSRESALTRSAVAVAVGLLFVAFSWFFARLSITNYQALSAHTIDLGLYDNIFWHSSHGDPLGTSYLKGGHHGSAHFDPILVLLSPLYLLHPRADGLLLLQAAWVGSTVVPLYLLTRHLLGSAISGIAVAAMYAAHPAVHGATLYEFHSLTLASPLLVWVLYFLERGRHRLYWLALIATMLCREDMPLTLCLVGLYAAMRGQRSLRLGWVTCLLCLGYFVLVKRVFMDSADPLNAGPGAYGYAYYFEALQRNGDGLRGMMVSLLCNPAFVLGTILAPAKIEYFAILLVPLALLPLAARHARVMLLYGLLLCALASKPAVYSIAFQYSTLTMPVAFAATAIALAQIDRWPAVTSGLLDATRLRRALLSFALVASALVSWKLGAIDPHHAFKAGFTTVTHELSSHAREDYEWLQATIATIPADASVAATSRLGPLVSNRREAYSYPRETLPGYVFVDEREMETAALEAHRTLVSRGDLVLLASRDSFNLYRRSDRGRGE